MERDSLLNPKHIEFVRNLSKSRLTQTIFEQMFKQTFQFRVYPFGYEYSHTDLAHDGRTSPDILTVRRKPDYLIYRTAPLVLSLVEVKLKKNLYSNDTYIGSSADELKKLWPGTFMFIATDQGFYMSSCEYISENRTAQPLEECSIFGGLSMEDKDKIEGYHKLMYSILRT